MFTFTYNLIWIYVYVYYYYREDIIQTYKKKNYLLYKKKSLSNLQLVVG